MKQKNVLAIFILLFIVVVAWIGGNIYHNSVSSTIPKGVSDDIKPIKPTFDNAAINKLRQRERINPSFEVESLTPTPALVPIQILPTPISTTGGQLLL